MNAGGKGDIPRKGQKPAREGRGQGRSGADRKEIKGKGDKGDIPNGIKLSVKIESN